MKTFAYRIDWYKQGFLHTAGHVKSHDQWSRRYVGSEHNSHGRNTWNTKAVDGITIIFTLSLMQGIVQQLIKNKTFERAI